MGPIEYPKQQPSQQYKQELSPTKNANRTSISQNEAKHLTCTLIEGCNDSTTYAI